MNNVKLSAAVLGLAGLISAGVANAAITYSYYFEQSAYTLLPGGTIPIYFEEVVESGDVPLLTPDNGLEFASFLLSSAPSTLTFESFAHAPAWDLSNASTDAAGTEVSLFSPVTNGVGAEPDLYTRRVLLGHIAFTGAGTTNFVASLSELNLSTFNGEIIDAGDEVLSADVMVTVVPEPSSLGLLVLGSAAVLRRRQR